MTDRVLPLEGVYNFRDFGGYAGRGGARVVRDRLYRSAHLARATPADLGVIDKLGLALVADLRRPTERSAEPSSWAGHAERGSETPWVLVTSGGDGEGLAPHIQYLKDAERITAEGVREYMLSAYESMAYDERHVDLFARVFRDLAETGGPLLVHCAAGKDRTGVLCGLILDGLGVSSDDVMDDYELTNTAVNLDGIAVQAATRIGERLGRDVTPTEIRPMACVSRDYLETAWRAIAERSGSLAAYRRDVLGVSADMEAALHDTFLSAV